MARNILQMALPMTVAQLINILYNIVDRMYLGRLPGHLSLTGLGLCLPIISILMGFANLCGMGGAPLCSIHRGKGENEEAERILGNSFTLLLLFGGGLTVFCLAFRRPILYLFGASDLTFPYANDYLTIYLLGTLFVMIGLGMNPFINAQGFSRMGMMTVALGAAVNIVLDPIFIFIFDMGVVGAAVATVIGQISGACIGFFLLWRLRRSFPISPRRFHFSPPLTGEILRIAAPAIVMQSLSSFMTLGLNQIMNLWSETGVFVLGVYFKIQSFVFMPIFGVNSGLIPIISYNYGAKDAPRISQSIRFGLQLGVCTGLAGTAILSLAASPLLRWCFQAPEEAVQMGVPALRMTALAFAVASVSIVLSAAFQSLDRSSCSLLVSLLRQIIFLLPIALLLIRVKPELVWLCFLLAELLTVAIAISLYRKTVVPRIRALEG